MANRQGRANRVASVLAALAFAVATGGCGPGGGGGGALTRQAPQIDRFIVAASDASDYKGIWRDAPTGRQLNKSLDVLAQADSSIARVQPDASSNAAEAWFQAYQSSTASVVTLIGHNEAGVFRFADGSSVNLAELSKYNGPTLIVFSCDAARNTQGQVVGTVPTTLALQAAAEIEQRVVATLNDDPVVAIDQLTVLVDGITANVISENSVYRLAGGTAVAATGVIGVSVYNVVD